MPSLTTFKLLKQEHNARRGEFKTVHGTVQTPAFQNVATASTGRNYHILHFNLLFNRYLDIRYRIFFFLGWGRNYSCRDVNLGFLNRIIHLNQQ